MRELKSMKLLKRVPVNILLFGSAVLIYAAIYLHYVR